MEIDKENIFDVMKKAVVLPWEMKEGELTKIRFNDKVFVCEQNNGNGKKTVATKIMQKKHNGKLLPKGEKIGKVHENVIYVNPLRDIIVLLTDGKKHSTTEIADIIMKYYKSSNKKTLMNNVYQYVKYLKSKKIKLCSEYDSSGASGAAKKFWIEDNLIINKAHPKVM